MPLRQLDVVSTTAICSVIDYEIEWREQELAFSKIHLQRCLNNHVEFKTAYRSFGALTYAHYEGFSKIILAKALDEIGNSGISYSACNETLKRTALIPEIRKRLKTVSDTDLYGLIEKGGASYDEIHLPLPEKLLDQGNLDVANFQWSVMLIGMDPALFAPFRGAIGQITSLRHKCAHGEELTLDPLKSRQDLLDDIIKLQEKIIILIHSLAVGVIDHLDRECFRI